MRLKFSQKSQDSIPLFALNADALSDWLENQSDATRRWIKAQGFTGAIGTICTIPNEDGAITLAVAGLGDARSRARGRFTMAAIAAKLPAGVYELATGHSLQDCEEHAVGWLLSQYSFDRYRTQPSHKAQLVCPKNLNSKKLEAIVAGEVLTRDLINTPASDMGPDALEAAAHQLAEQHNASVNVMVGDDLLTQNFPMIHAVGRASPIAPRLIDMNWGDTGPTLVLVGKGVCFDTGGLNIKPGASMGLMKKDMGGAATVLGLAHMIMELGLKLQLRVLIPAVENSIDGSAFRPQDILTSRKGLTVEINNTDAEGRLVLADALALADETPPDLMICMATLTGAARVAVGPDLAPFFTEDAPFADALRVSARDVRDPVWELPFHAPYEAMIEPGIADLDNAPKGSFAGTITAALFLRRFVSNTARFAHFDIYGWQPVAAPGRPKGGVGMGARAILEALPKVLNL